MSWKEIGVTIKGNIDFGDAKNDIKEVTSGIGKMKQAFADMPNFTRIVDASLEKTATVAENLGKTFDKLSDENLSDESRARYEQQAESAIGELNSMRVLRTGNTDFSTQMAHSWFGGLPEAIRKEFDSITPEVANIIRTRLSSLNKGGKQTGATSIPNLINGIMYSGGGGVKDKEILNVLAKHNVSADAAMDFDEYLKYLLPHIVPMQYLKEYQKQRYGTALPKSNYFDRGNPLDFIPESYKRSWGHRYQYADLTDEQARMVLGTEQRNKLDKLLANDPIAVRAAVTSGISRRDNRGMLETQEEITRAQWEDFRSALYDEMVARVAGMAKGRVDDPYAHIAGLDRKTLAGRLSQSSSGSAVLAMKAIEAMNDASVWGSATGNTYWRKNYIEPKRALDSYVVEKYSPFVRDQGYDQSKSVEINESQATRVLGQGRWKHNDDVSGVIRLVSLEGYDKTNQEHAAELRNLWRNGKTFNGVPFVVDTVHSGKDGPVIRMIAQNARDEANARVAQWAIPAGFTGSYFGNFSDKVIEDIIENGTDPSRLTAKMHGKYFESLNKKWSPSADLGLNTEGIRIAVVDTSGKLGGKDIEFGDGAMWASGEVLKDSFQTRIGAAGKGSVFTFTGKNLGAAFEKWGLLDEQGRAMVKGPNGEYYDASSANVMLPLSIIKNQMAYMKKNDDGTYTFRPNDEINRMAEAEVRNLGWGEMTNYEKDDRHSDNIGVQQMSFLNFSPKTRTNQIELALKRMKELDTETGQLKYVFGDQNDWFSQQVTNNPQLLGTAQAKAWVDNYRTRMIQDIISGTFFDFGESDSKFSNVVAAANPLSAIVQSMYGGNTSGMIARAREILQNAGIDKEYSDQEIEDMIVLKPKNVVDFGHTNPEHENLTMLRSPSGYGNILKATNLAVTHGDAIRALYEGFGISTTAGAYMSEADRDILQGIDFDSDHFKIIHDPTLVAEIEELTKNQVFSKQGLEKTIKDTGDLKDVVEQGAQFTERLTEQSAGMGFGSGGARGMMLDLSNPVIAARYVPGMQIMQAIYDAASTDAKNPVAYTTPQEAWDVINLQKEYTKFTDHAHELFRYDDDMYIRDEHGNITKDLDYSNPDLFKTTINGKEGPAVNMRALRAMGIDNINAPSVNMANQVMGLAFANMLYRSGMSDTTKWDAISQAMDALEYGTEGPARQELMSTMRHMLPEWASGKRGRISDEEEYSIREMIANAEAELEDEANKSYSSEQKGYVSPSGRVYKDVKSYIEGEGRKYSINTATQMVDLFGFTSHFGKAKLGDDFFDQMFENVGTTDILSESARTYRDQRTKYVEELEKAKQEIENSKASETTAPKITSPQKGQSRVEAALEKEGPRFGPGSTDQSYKGYTGENKPEVTPESKPSAGQTQTPQSDAEKRVAELEQKIKDLDATQAHRVETQVKHQQLMKSAEEAITELDISARGNENKVKGVSQAHKYWNKQYFGVVKPILDQLEDESNGINEDTVLSDKEKQTLLKDVQNKRTDLYRNLSRDFVSKAIAYTKQVSDSITDAIENTEEKSSQKKKLDELDEGIKESKGYEEEITKKMRLDRSRFTQEEQDLYGSGLETVRANLRKQEEERARLVDRYTKENEQEATLAMEELEGRFGYRDRNSLSAQIQNRRDLIQKRREAITQDYNEGLMSKGFYDEQIAKLAQYDDNAILDVVNENKKALGLGGKTPKQKADEWKQKRLSLSSELMEAANRAYEIIDSQSSPEAVEKAVHDLQAIQEVYDKLPDNKTIDKQAQELEKRLIRQEKNITTGYRESISGKRPDAETRALRNVQSIKDQIADRIMEVGADSSLGKELQSILDDNSGLWENFTEREKEREHKKDETRNAQSRISRHNLEQVVSGQYLSKRKAAEQAYDQMMLRRDQYILEHQNDEDFDQKAFEREFSEARMKQRAQEEVDYEYRQRELALNTQQRQTIAKLGGRSMTREERAAQIRDNLEQQRNNLYEELRKSGRTAEASALMFTYGDDVLTKTANDQLNQELALVNLQNENMLASKQQHSGYELEQMRSQFARSQQQMRRRYSRSRIAQAMYGLEDQRYGLNQKIAGLTVTRDDLIRQQKLDALSLKDYIKNNGGDAKALKEDTEYQKRLAKVQANHEDISKYNSQIAEATSEVDQLSSVGARASAAFTALGSSIGMIAQRLGRQLFQKALQETKRFVKEFDSSMNEIQAITLKSNDEMQDVRSQTINKALGLRTSVSNVANVEAALYRQGLSDAEVSTRTDSIIKFATVTKLNVQEATKIITTALQNDLVNSAEAAMDALVALGDNAATTAAEIGKGMQKAAASAKVAGVSYEELTALLTIGTSDTQLSGTQVGTALQTVFTRMRRLSLSGYTADQNGEKTTASDAEAALASVGVDLWDDKSIGKMRTAYEVLSDLSKIWQNLSDAQKSIVTNALAGTRQTNIFSTLMEGMSEDGGETLDKYLGLAEGSEGITQSKYEIAMQSLSASMDEFRSSWDALVESMISGGSITGALDGVSELLQNLAGLADNGGQAGLMLGVVAGGIAAIGVAISGIATGPAGVLLQILAAVAGFGAVAGLTSLFTGDNRTEVQKHNDERAAALEEINQFNANDKTQANYLQKSVENVRKYGKEWQEVKNSSNIDAIIEAQENLRNSLSDLAVAFPEISGQVLNAIKDLSQWEEAVNKAGEIADDFSDRAKQKEKERIEEYQAHYLDQQLSDEALALGSPETMVKLRRATYNAIGSLIGTANTGDLSQFDFAASQNLFAEHKGQYGKTDVLRNLYYWTEDEDTKEFIRSFFEGSIAGDVLVGMGEHGRPDNAADVQTLNAGYDRLMRYLFSESANNPEFYKQSLRGIDTKAIRRLVSERTDFDNLIPENADYSADNYRSAVLSLLLGEVYNENGELNPEYNLNGRVDFSKVRTKLNEYGGKNAEQVQNIIDASNSPDKIYSVDGHRFFTESAARKFVEQSGGKYNTSNIEKSGAQMYQTADKLISAAGLQAQKESEQRMIDNVLEGYTKIGQLESPQLLTLAKALTPQGTNETEEVYNDRIKQVVDDLQLGNIDTTSEAYKKAFESLRLPKGLTEYSDFNEVVKAYADADMSSVLSSFVSSSPERLGAWLLGEQTGNYSLFTSAVQSSQAGSMSISDYMSGLVTMLAQNPEIVESFASDFEGVYNAFKSFFGSDSDRILAAMKDQTYLSNEDMVKFVEDTITNSRVTKDFGTKRYLQSDLTNMAQKVASSGAKSWTEARSKLDFTESDWSALESAFPDLKKYMELSPEQQATEEGQRIKLNYEVAIAVSGVSELEQAGEVLQGTANLIEGLKRGGEFEIKAKISLDNQFYENQQIIAKLTNGTLGQRIEAQRALGVSESIINSDQIEAQRQAEEIARYRTGQEAGTLTQMMLRGEQEEARRLAETYGYVEGGSVSEADAVNMLTNMGLSRFGNEWLDSTGKINKEATNWFNSGRKGYVFSGESGNIDYTNPNLGQGRRRNAYELNMAQRELLQATTDEERRSLFERDADLYTAAEQAYGEHAQNVAAMISEVNASPDTEITAEEIEREQELAIEELNNSLRQQIQGYKDNLTSASQAVNAFDNYEFNPEEYASVLDSFLPFKNKQEIEQIMNGSDQAKKDELKQELQKQIDSVLNQIADALKIDIDPSNTSTAFETLAEALRGVDKDAANILLQIAGMFDEFGDLSPDSTAKTLETLSSEYSSKKGHDEKLKSIVDEIEAGNVSSINDLIGKQKLFQSQAQLEEFIATLNNSKVSDIFARAYANGGVFSDSDITGLKNESVYGGISRNQNYADQYQKLQTAINENGGLNLERLNELLLDEDFQEWAKGLEYFNDVMDDTEGAVNNTSEAWKSLNAEAKTGYEESIEKWGKDTPAVISAMKKANGTLEDRLELMTQYNNLMSKQGGAKGTLSRWKSGEKLTDADKSLISSLGFNAPANDKKYFDNIQKAGKSGSKEIDKATKDLYDRILSSLEMNEGVSQKAAEVIGQGILEGDTGLEQALKDYFTSYQMGEIEIDAPGITVNADGSVSFDGGALVSEMSGEMDALTQQLIQAALSAGGTATATVKTTDDSVTVEWTFNPGSGGDSNAGGGGGGGGGGGKSAAQKAIDDAKHNLVELEHLQKMYDIGLKHAEYLNNPIEFNANFNSQRQNYSEMAQVYRQNIADLEEQRAALDETSDDYWALTDAINGYEEALEELKNKLIELNKQRIDFVQQIQDVADSVQDRVLTVTDAEKEYAKLIEDYDRVRRNVATTIATKQESIAQNEPQIAEWRAEYDRIVKEEGPESQNAVDILNKIAEIEAEQYSLNSEIVQEIRDLNALESEILQIQLRRETEISSGNSRIAQSGASLAEAQENYAKQRQFLRDDNVFIEEQLNAKLAASEGLLARVNDTKLKATDPDNWSNDLEAYIVNLEEIDQLQIQMIENQRALVESFITEITQGYEDATRAASHYTEMASAIGDIFKTDENFEAYRRAMRDSITLNAALRRATAEEADELRAQLALMDASAPGYRELQQALYEAEQQEVGFTKAIQDNTIAMEKNVTEEIKLIKERMSIAPDTYSSMAGSYADMYKRNGQWDDYKEALQIQIDSAEETRKLTQTAAQDLYDRMTKTKGEIPETGLAARKASLEADRDARAAEYDERLEEARRIANDYQDQLNDVQKRRNDLLANPPQLVIPEVEPVWEEREVGKKTVGRDLTAEEQKRKKQLVNKLMSLQRELEALDKAPDFSQAAWESATHEVNKISVRHTQNEKVNPVVPNVASVAGAIGAAMQKDWEERGGASRDERRKGLEEQILRVQNEIGKLSGNQKVEVAETEMVNVAQIEAERVATEEYEAALAEYNQSIDELNNQEAELTSLLEEANANVLTLQAERDKAISEFGDMIKYVSDEMGEPFFTTAESYADAYQSLAELMKQDAQKAKEVFDKISEYQDIARQKALYNVNEANRIYSGLINISGSYAKVYGQTHEYDKQAQMYAASYEARQPEIDNIRTQAEALYAEIMSHDESNPWISTEVKDKAIKQYQAFIKQLSDETSAAIQDRFNELNAMHAKVTEENSDRRRSVDQKMSMNQIVSSVYLNVENYEKYREILSNSTGLLHDSIEMRYAHIEALKADMEEYKDNPQLIRQVTDEINKEYQAIANETKALQENKQAIQANRFAQVQQTNADTRRPIDQKMAMNQVLSPIYLNNEDYERYREILGNTVDKLQASIKQRKANIEAMKAEMELYKDNPKLQRQVIEEINKEYLALGNDTKALQENTRAIQENIFAQTQQANTDARRPIEHKMAMDKAWGEVYLNDEQFDNYRSMLGDTAQRLKESIAQRKANIEALKAERELYRDNPQLLRQNTDAINQEEVAIANDTKALQDNTKAIQENMMAQIQLYTTRANLASQENASLANTYASMAQQAWDWEGYRSMLGSKSDAQRQTAYNNSVEINTLSRYLQKGFITDPQQYQAAVQRAYQLIEENAGIQSSLESDQRAIAKSRTEEIGNNLNIGIAQSSYLNDVYGQWASRYASTKNYAGRRNALDQQINYSNQMIEEYEKAVSQLRFEIAGMEKNSPEWYEATEKLYSFQSAIQKLKISVEEAAEAIKKSFIEELLEKLSFADSIFNHQITMANTRMEMYKNNDELTNVNYILEYENGMYEERKGVIESNIAQLEAQLPEAESDPELYKQVTSAIMRYEEELEKTTTTIEANNKAIRENNKLILEYKKNIEDTIDEEIKLRIKEERDMLNGTTTIQNRILEILRKSYRDRFELYEKDIQKQKEALNEEKALLNQRLEMRKKALNQERQDEKLAELQRQLALISADSSRTKEAKELRKQIQEMQQDRALTLAEDEVSSQAEQIDDQIKAIDDNLEHQRELLEEYLEDANNFTEIIDTLISGSFEDLTYWIQQNDETYKNSLDATKQEMLLNWEDTWKQMRGIVDTFWEQITEIMSSEESFIAYMQNSSSYKNASDTGKEYLTTIWSEAYKRYVNSTKDDGEYSHSDNYNLPSGGEEPSTEPYVGLTDNTEFIKYVQYLAEQNTASVEAFKNSVNGAKDSDLYNRIINADKFINNLIALKSEAEDNLARMKPEDDGYDKLVQTINNLAARIESESALKDELNKQFDEYLRKNLDDALKETDRAISAIEAIVTDTSNDLTIAIGEEGLKEYEATKNTLAENRDDLKNFVDGLDESTKSTVLTLFNNASEGYAREEEALTTMANNVDGSVSSTAEAFKEDSYGAANVFKEESGILQESISTTEIEAALQRTKDTENFLNDEGLVRDQFLKTEEEERARYLSEQSEAINSAAKQEADALDSATDTMGDIATQEGIDLDNATTSMSEAAQQEADAVLDASDEFNTSSSELIDSEEGLVTSETELAEGIGDASEQFSKDSDDLIDSEGEFAGEIASDIGTFSSVVTSLWGVEGTATKAIQGLTGQEKDLTTLLNDWVKDNGKMDQFVTGIGNGLDKYSSDIENSLSLYAEDIYKYAAAVNGYAQDLDRYAQAIGVSIGNFKTEIANFETTIGEEITGIKNYVSTELGNIRAEAAAAATVSSSGDSGSGSSGGGSSGGGSNSGGKAKGGNWDSPDLSSEQTGGVSVVGKVFYYGWGLEKQKDKNGNDIYVAVPIKDPNSSISMTSDEAHQLATMFSNSTDTELLAYADSLAEKGTNARYGDGVGYFRAGSYWKLSNNHYLVLKGYDSNGEPILEETEKEPSNPEAKITTQTFKQAMNRKNAIELTKTINSNPNNSRSNQDQVLYQGLNSEEQALLEDKNKNKNTKLGVYASGGLVDYTGPAWVDGTKTKPEAFLDPIDTKLIKQLADTLRYVYVASPMMPSTDIIGGNSNTIGDINITINQAELKSDADYEDVARRVGDAFTRQLSKQGFNLSNYAS